MTALMNVVWGKKRGKKTGGRFFPPGRQDLNTGNGPCAALVGER